MEKQNIAGASEASTLEFFKTISSYQSELDDLRADGVHKINSLKNEIRKIKNNHELSNQEKQKMIAADQKQIQIAMGVAKKNQQSIAVREQKAVKYVKSFYEKSNVVANLAWKKQIESIKKSHAAKVNEINKQNQAQMTRINGLRPKNNNDKNALLAYQNALKTQQSIYRQQIFEEKTSYGNAIQKIKNEKHANFLQEYHLLGSLRNDRNTIGEELQSKFENYAYQFNIKDFLIKNGLYIVLLVFMIISLIITQGSVLNANGIVNILKNFSYKVFYALGVAGLILLAGTDLSVGRMVTLGTLIVCMVLNPNSATKFFGIDLSKLYFPNFVFGSVLIAIILSVIFCTLFSAIAGFFSAKFKIHPFISTLGTQMIIWGLCVVGTSAVKTGSIADAAKLFGTSLGASRTWNGFPIIFFYALITIIIVSFIWNKTKFGKYLYAVGGNPDAASVSGISVFWVTMGAFIMAGILYGLGGFVAGVTIRSADSAQGQGWEMEAIAACVVGGISFMGGIGKVSGAVLGCLIFEILKYFLNGVVSAIGASNGTDIANIFIGVIILLAVTFDSLKYLKKK